MNENNSVAKKENKWLKPERIISLSDGIFAFAMTLLVLTIDIPDVKNAADLTQALLSDLNKFYTYLFYYILYSFSRFLGFAP